MSRLKAHVIAAVVMAALLAFAVSACTWPRETGLAFMTLVFVGTAAMIYFVIYTGARDSK